MNAMIAQNMNNPCLKTGVKSDAKTMRHRLSDQKWRQNVNNGFAALKTIVRNGAGRKASQMRSSLSALNGKALKKKPSKRMSKIKTLQSTIDLIRDSEAVIENMVNERQNQLMDKYHKNEVTVRPDIASNGLQRIRDLFESFERRHQKETAMESMDSKVVEKRVADKPMVTTAAEDNCDTNCTPKTVDALLPEVNVDSEDIVQEFKREVLTPEWPSPHKKTVDDINDSINYTILSKVEVDIKQELDENNNIDANLVDHYFDDQLSGEIPLDLLDVKPFTSDLSFNGSSYGFDGKEYYLTTDLAEHLASNIPLTPFSASLTYI